MNFVIMLILVIILLETTLLLLFKLRKTDFSSSQKRKIYVDTSVLMDGRILAIVESGFLDGNLIIPQSVLHELQLLADGKDSEKRTRARHGLDVAHNLSSVDGSETSILYDALDYTPVDNRLLELAKTNHGYIMTNDFNLNKVAVAEGIPVLNINDLVMVLRGEYLPGEHAVVKISAVGSSAHQGIGYLTDGTMIVVENASNRVGKEVEVEFIRFIQTSAGKMVFGKIAEKDTTKNVRAAHRTSGRALPRASSPADHDKPARMPRNSTEAEDELIKLLAESESDLDNFNLRAAPSESSPAQAKAAKKTARSSRKSRSTDSKTGKATSRRRFSKPK